MNPTVDRVPNQEQEAVIRELDRNLILFASAGTGKTFTVARHVDRILEEGRAKPEEILCLTFTIKAAGEMRDDIASYAGEKARDVAVSTIHAFAFRVLKEESLENPETCSMPGVCDEDDASETLRRIALELGARENEGILGEKSRKRNVLFSIACELKQRRERMDRYTEDDERDYGEVYREMLEKNPELIWQMTDMGYRGDSPDLAFRRFLDSSAGTLMARYDQSLRESNLLDFEDLICRTHRLFRTQDGKTRWRERFRYIILDEMQDTSELEYDMLKNLFPGNHVMMCGDFFQTIYEWRGSRPEIVLEEYIRDFHAERFMFTQNYRSTRLLTRATFGYLKKTCPRLLGQYCPPEIVTRSGVEGEPIRNVRLADEQAEAAWIYRYLKEHRPEDPLRVCLMARSNEYIRRLYTHLDAMGKRDGADDRIRFMTVEETAKFFRRAVIRDLLAFVRILVNPSDVLAAERICKTYVTGVGKETQRKIREMAPSGVNLASFMDPAAYRDGDPWEQLIRARKEGNLVIYDTETTGLDLRKDQVIQISAIRLNAQGQVVDTLDQMVIPTVPISSRAQATHGQTMETILRRGGIPAEDALKRFLDFVRGSVLVGHNSLRFDRVILRRQILENSLPLPEIIAEYDTLPLAQQCLPKSENYKLGTLCRRFDIVNENAHDALGGYHGHRQGAPVPDG